MSWARYKKIRELGRGAMCDAVYLCADTTVKPTASDPDANLVAIKCIGLAGSSAAERRSAINEVAILRNLNHPNVLRFHECFIDDQETMCIVTEYVDGGDLNDIVERCGHGGGASSSSSSPGSNRSSVAANGPAAGLFSSRHFHGEEEEEQNAVADPSPRSALKGRFFIDAIVIVDIAEQVLKGLAYLHQQQIIHRDIKASNILLTKDGVAKIADFSISRVLSRSISGVRSFAATPLTMAPEVCSGLKHAFSSDIWSFAVMLFEIYVGEVPFQAGNLLALVCAITEGKYDTAKLRARPYSGFVADGATTPSPTASSDLMSKQVQKEVCDAIVQIVEAALVLAPEERPTARELLLRFFTEDPYAAAPAGGSGPMPLLSSSITPPAPLVSSAASSSPKTRESSAAAAAHDEVVSVVRSSYASSVANRLDAATEFVTLSGSQQSTSVVSASGSGATAGGPASNEDDEDAVVVKDYEDDFEDDLLSISHRSRQKQQQEQEEQQKQQPPASGRPPSNPAGVTQKQQPASSSSSVEKSFESTADVQEKIEQLPWLLEPELFENIEIDAVSGHGPLFFVNKSVNKSVAAAADPFLSSGAIPEQFSSPNQQQQGVADLLQRQHHQFGAATGPVVSQQLQQPQTQQQQQQQTPHNLRYLQQHRGSHTGMVVECVTPSVLGRGRSGSVATSSASATTTMTSLVSHRDPSSLPTAGGAAGGPLPLSQWGSVAASASAGAAINSVDLSLASQRACNEDMQQKIRDRALVYHKKRIAQLAKERQQMLDEGEKKQQQQQQQQQQASPQPQPAAAAAAVAPLSTTLLGQRRTAADERREYEELLKQRREMEERQRRPSAVLTDIVEARARGLISGALLSAFPHLMKKKEVEKTKTAPRKQRQDDDEDDDDEEEDEEEEIFDEEEEEEEEESDVDDDEFKVLVHFSHAVATALHAVPFVGKRASAMVAPATFAPFSVKARLYTDAAYKDLLAAVQQQVVFFGASGDSNADTATLAGSVTSKKLKKQLGASGTLSASYKLLSACVPLSFEHQDRGGGGGEEAVESRSGK